VIVEPFPRNVIVAPESITTESYVPGSMKIVFSEGVTTATARAMEQGSASLHAAPSLPLPKE
jgi:hypothetical protein